MSLRTPFRASDGSLWRCKQWFTCRLAMPLPKQGQDPVGAKSRGSVGSLTGKGRQGARRPVLARVFVRSCLPLEPKALALHCWPELRLAFISLADLLTSFFFLDSGVIRE